MLSTGFSFLLLFAMTNTLKDSSFSGSFRQIEYRYMAQTDFI